MPVPVPRWTLVETRDGGSEPYLINSPDGRRNPPLVVINRKRRRHMGKTITLRRNSKGRFVKASASHKKRKHKSNYISAGSIVNRPRHKKHKRHYRRNPPQMLSLAGSMIPPIDTLAGVTAGLVGPSVVAGVIAQMSPTTVAQYPTMVKIGSNAIVLGAGYLIGGRKGMRDVAVGEIGAFLAQQIASLVNKYAATTMQGYTGPVPRRGATGLGHGVRGYIAGAAVSRQNLSQFPARASRLQSRFRRLIP